MKLAGGLNDIITNNPICPVSQDPVLGICEEEVCVAAWGSVCNWEDRFQGLRSTQKKQ